MGLDQWKRSVSVLAVGAAGLMLLSGCHKYHEWMPATLEAPKTCRICGETEGEPVHAMILEWLPDMMEEWTNMSVSDETVILSKTGEDQLTFGVFDYQGILLKEVKLTFDQDDNWSWSQGYYPESVGFQVEVVHQDGSGELQLYDIHGEVLKEIPFTTDADDPVHLQLMATENDGFLAEMDADRGGTGPESVVYYLDLQEYALAEPTGEEGYLPAEVVYDSEVFEECQKQAVGGKTAYYVSTENGAQWGYANDDFVPTGLYVDATPFSTNGYALVSDDGVSYDIVDRDLNVVAEDYIQGRGAYARGQSPVLVCYDSAESRYILVW